MHYLYWDIDGTLLLTGHAGIAALQEAIRLKFNTNDFQFSHTLAGCTDTQIVKTAIKEIKGSCTAADAAGVLIHYYRLLPDFLAKHHGYLLPNVEQTLASLPKANFTSALLTGNASPAAHLKLKHFGLTTHFDYTLSVFGELSEDRDMLAQVALHKLKLQNPKITANQITIIGDTPNDIKCAHAIGARSLIVLSGSTYSATELASYHPWKIIPELPVAIKDLLAILEVRS
ncbi:MAG TPA: HAD family hydrolase [Candidatus Avacidaminococcus intestinavium]|uniref:HAD family hydrolase n=1 Tax=Candidatus Avacidaminococcus intestinavium TaxID=2840684 RepID=A0A9D1SKD6_9FIRM|nr:HAD family hydrolase [Candidatus Avacidaminococcus intestinavium]